jgi:hypothetical protein
MMILISSHEDPAPDTVGAPYAQEQPQTAPYDGFMMDNDGSDELRKYTGVFEGPEKTLEVSFPNIMNFDAELKVIILNLVVMVALVFAVSTVAILTGSVAAPVVPFSRRFQTGIWMPMSYRSLPSLCTLHVGSEDLRNDNSSSLHCLVGGLWSQIGFGD